MSVLLTNKMVKHIRLDKLSKEDYRTATRAAKLLYASLGLFGARVPFSMAKALGIRGIKRLPPGEYSELDVMKHLVGFDVITYIEALEVLPDAYFPNLRRDMPKLVIDPEWCNIKGKSDLRIKGCKPKYDIYSGRYWHLKDMRSLILGRYFNAYELYDVLTLDDETILRLLQLDFPMERLDELKFAIRLGLDIFKNKLAVILRRLDYIKERDLAHSYYDNNPIEYRDKVIELAELNNMTLPATGLELKRAALRFKNCAASYVNQAVEGTTVIMYDDKHMAQVNPAGTRLLQFYGKRNTPAQIEFKGLKDV